MTEPLHWSATSLSVMPSAPRSSGAATSARARGPGHRRPHHRQGPPPRRPARRRGPAGRPADRPHVPGRQRPRPLRRPRQGGRGGRQPDPLARGPRLPPGPPSRRRGAGPALVSAPARLVARLRPADDGRACLLHGPVGPYRDRPDRLCHRERRGHRLEDRSAADDPQARRSGRCRSSSTRPPTSGWWAATRGCWCSSSWSASQPTRSLPRWTYSLNVQEQLVDAGQKVLLKRLLDDNQAQVDAGVFPLNVSSGLCSPSWCPFWGTCDARLIKPLAEREQPGEAEGETVEESA